MSSREWLERFPVHKFVSLGSLCSNLIWINRDEFIAAVDNEMVDDKTKKEYDGIVVYNKIKNTWQLFMEYQSLSDTSSHSMCYNPIKHKIFVYGWENNMNIFDIKTKEHKVFTDCLETSSGILKPVLLNIKGDCHVICGSNNNYHLKWNFKDEKFEQIFKFPDFEGGINGHSVIHIKSKNMLYLFGGYDHFRDVVNHSIWKCYIDGDNGVEFEWKESENEQLQKLGASEILKDSAISTPDETYIVFLGRNNVHLMDMNDDTFYKVEMDGFVETERAILDGCEKYEVLVDGYLREISNKNNVMIPNELMLVIKEYYVIQEIYIINNDATHFKISLDDIMSAKREML